MCTFVDVAVLVFLRCRLKLYFSPFRLLVSNETLEYHYNKFQKKAIHFVLLRPSKVNVLNLSNVGIWTLIRIFDII